MKLILFSSFFAIFGLFVACTKEVKIEIPGYKKQLVVDGNIETGAPAIVLLSTTNDIYSPTNLDAYINGFISGATVIVSNGTITDTLLEICSDNLPPGTEEIAAAFFGIPVEQLINLHLCAYISNQIIGEVGKTYSLKVVHEGKEYNAQTTILSPTSFDESYWKPEPGLPEHGFAWMKLTDSPQSGDAYKWEVKRISDIGFTKPFGPFFNDRFFNGLTFEFAYENPMSFNDPTIPSEFKGYYHLGDTIVLKLSKLGNSEFQFFEKKYNQIFSAGNPFATPVNVPSNISGGALGVWAGFSPSFDTLICVP
jgi:hypothetical protein